MSLNPVDKWKLQQQEELKAALRSGKSGTKLLDDGENNIGNATKLEPIPLPPGPNNYSKVPAPSNNSRLLNLTASSKQGQSITVVITAARVPDADGFVGPITGIVEFGNGSSTTKVEFDVPIGPYIGDIAHDQKGDQPQDSGAIVQVPTGIVRAFARYDNLFITPTVLGVVPFPQTFGPNIGTNGPPQQLPAPVNVKAFAAYFGRVFSRLYKTQYLYIAPDAVTPVSMLGLYCIPPFAKFVRVVREPQTASITLRLWDGLPGAPVSLPTNNFYEEYVVASGPSPRIPIEGNESFIRVSSTTANPADRVNSIKLVYEIGL